MTKSQYNIILALLFIILAKQYLGGGLIAWFFFGLAVIFFLRALAAHGRAYKEKNFKRPDIDHVPPTVGDKDHSEDDEE